MVEHTTVLYMEVLTIEVYQAIGGHSKLFSYLPNSHRLVASVSIPPVAQSDLSVRLESLILIFEPLNVVVVPH